MERIFKPAMKNPAKFIQFSISFLFLASVFIVSCTFPKHAPRRNLTMVFYNVENLFDTLNTEGIRDGEFTPEGRNKWNEMRYQKKLNDLSRVISGINKTELPEIIGLCEVENEQVIKDLVQTRLLANGGYSAVHYESPDTRGIDCALIYRPDEFNVLYHVAVPVRFKNKPNSKTRDILYVKGSALNREEFHIFINHWPSRIGGVAETESKRVAAAKILKGKIDSVKLASPKAHIIVMGDMNDEPNNKSLQEILEPGQHDTPGARFTNLMFPDFIDGMGSYYYRGKWNMLDNIIVSGGLLDSKGWCIREKKGFIYRERWMENINRNGDIFPKRTYECLSYSGGPSDHFPVYFRLRR